MNKDTFKCLENLENLQEQIRKDSESRNKASHDQTISALKAKREQSKRKLEVLEKVVAQEEAEVGSVDKELSVDLEEAEKNLEKLKILRSAYNFSDVSCAEVERRSLLVRFATSYQREFKDVFFLELKKSEDALSIASYDLPPFVPVEELAEKYLSTDQKHFLWLVSSYLQHYVKRREEATLTKEIFALEDAPFEMNMTLPVDYIEFKLGRADVLQLEARLSYSDLLKIVPTKVNMEIVFDDEELPLMQEQVQKWKELLGTESLSKATETIWGEMKKNIKNEEKES